IAMAYGTTVRAIQRANGIGRAAFVHVGQRLLVAEATRDGAGGVAPASARAATAAAASATPTGGATEGGGPAAGTDDGAAGSGAAGRRIVIDLSDQTLSAYDGGRLANRFIVSSGSPWTPTPIGTYAVYMRLESQRMVGPGYDLPGVPFVQYFTGSYAIHGAYWHQRFGIPVSHGCVNLQPGDAAWLWSWSEVGTPVIVQP
ncbi:MAG: L,D-transpeptidase family protein, partial [Ardenticatenales bacterium]